MSATAVGNPLPRPVGVSLAAGNAREQQFHVEGLPLGTRGGAVIEHYFPSDGDYLLHIGNLIGGTHRPGQEHVNTVVALLDGKKFFELDIGGGEDSVKLDQLGAPAVEEINARLKSIPFTTTAGVHRLGVTFLHRSFAESDRVLPSLVPGDGQEAVMTLSRRRDLRPRHADGLEHDAEPRADLHLLPERCEPRRGVRRRRSSPTWRGKAFRGASSDEDMRAVHAAVRARRRGRRLREGIKYALSGDAGASEVPVSLRAGARGSGARLGVRA